jgi:hypothetical protein
MGGLASRPKIPSPQPTPVVQPSTPTQPDPEVTQAEREQSISEQRTSNLLRRSRGRFGTIRTGFRGLLDLVPTDTQRKTLLGE